MEHPKSVELSMEQEFNLRSFETKVKNMNHSQAQEFLVELYKSMLLREEIYKRLLKREWGIE